MGMNAGAGEGMLRERIGDAEVVPAPAHDEAGVKVAWFFVQPTRADCRAAMVGAAQRRANGAPSRGLAATRSSARSSARPGGRARGIRRAPERAVSRALEHEGRSPHGPFPWARMINGKAPNPALLDVTG